MFLATILVVLLWQREFERPYDAYTSLSVTLQSTTFRRLASLSPLFEIVSPRLFFESRLLRLHLGRRCC
jgi:hypothetical protein